MLRKVLAVCFLISLAGAAVYNEEMRLGPRPPRTLGAAVDDEGMRLRPRPPGAAVGNEETRLGPRILGRHKIKKGILLSLGKDALSKETDKPALGAKKEAEEDNFETYRGEDDDDYLDEMFQDEEQVYRGENEEEMNGDEYEIYTGAEESFRGEDFMSSDKPADLEEVSEKPRLEPLNIPPVFRKIIVTVYRRNEEPNTGTAGSPPEFALDKDTVFLVHGTSHKMPKYLREFFDVTVNALLSENDYTVVTLNWAALVQKEKTLEGVKNNIATAGNVGEVMGSIINIIRQNPQTDHNIYAIGHDLGTVAIQRAAMKVRRPIEFIYGINQRHYRNKRYGRNYLREDSGNLVQTLTTNGFPYSFTHRDFYPNEGKITRINDDQSYKLFAEDIKANGTKFLSTLCYSFKDYQMNKCKGFPKASFWNKFSIAERPEGKYYIQLPMSKNVTKRKGQCA